MMSRLARVCRMAPPRPVSWHRSGTPLWAAPGARKSTGRNQAGRGSFLQVEEEDAARRGARLGLVEVGAIRFVEMQVRAGRIVVAGEETLRGMGWIMASTAMVAQATPALLAHSTMTVFLPQAAGNRIETAPWIDRMKYRNPLMLTTLGSAGPRPFDRSWSPRGIFSVRV